VIDIVVSLALSALFSFGFHSVSCSATPVSFAPCNVLKAYLSAFLAICV
jgi:hypothetical protein